MFEMSDQEQQLHEVGIAVDRNALKADWQATMHNIMQQATLAIPAEELNIGGGRVGMHTEHLGFLLAEMQYLQRTYPGQQW
jgi:ring-1,2-phenylacetyl-CoA epoxidase subunit PaaC